jgi:hypothetical protein
MFLEERSESRYIQGRQCEDTGKRQPSISQDGHLARNLCCSHLELSLPASKTIWKCVVNVV